MSVTPRDLTALRLVGSPSIVPGGEEVVAAVQGVDPHTSRYTGTLWTFSPHRPAWPLTDAGPWSDTMPRVAPDGSSVAFLSDRGGSRAVWLVRDGEPPTRLDGPDAPPTALAWLDADRLLVLAERPADDGDGAPVVIDWLRYKADGSAGPPEPTSELWLVPVDGPGTRVHTSEERLGCLTVTGREVLCTARPRHSDEVEPAVEVRRLDLDGGRPETVWRCASPVQALAVTADGQVLALASGEPGQSATPPRLWLAGQARPAFPDADLECERAVLSDCRPRTAPALLRARGQEALFTATVGHEVALFAGVAGTRPSRVSPQGYSLVDFAVDEASGSTALCLESATEPVELYLNGVRISELNTAWAKRAEPVAPREITVTAADGLEMAGLFYRSPTGDGAVLIRVHGGPHMAFGNTFDLETQTQISAGYHVLVPNIRGSAGRGARYRALSVGEWGRADHSDLMAFADWAERADGTDPARLYLAGGSYGGYLINWALTRTDRFRAAVSERSVSNLLSKYGTSDNGFTVNRFEFAGLDLFDEDGARELLDRSPLRHAAAISTPVLLIHGERDQRCPIEQSEQLFAALRRTGTEAVLARFPGESHGFTANGRPDRRMARLKMIIDWLDDHR